MAKLLQITNPWKICFTEIYFRNSFLQAFLVVILFPKLGQSQFSTNSRYFCFLTFSLKFFLTLIEISYYSRQISHIHVTLKQCIWLGNFAGVLRTKLQWKYFVLSIYTIPKFFSWDYLLRDFAWPVCAFHGTAFRTVYGKFFTEFKLMKFSNLSNLFKNLIIFYAWLKGKIIHIKLLIKIPGISLIFLVSYFTSKQFPLLTGIFHYFTFINIIAFTIAFTSAYMFRDRLLSSLVY